MVWTTNRLTNTHSVVEDEARVAVNVNTVGTSLNVAMLALTLIGGIDKLMGSTLNQTITRCWHIDISIRTDGNTARLVRMWVGLIPKIALALITCIHILIWSTYRLTIPQSMIVEITSLTTRSTA